MNCDHLREQLIDVASGCPASPELESHLKACADCEQVLVGLRQTMALLDEWQTPEPTPYFDVRMQARLREEQARGSRSWLEWFRRPVLAGAAVLLVAAGVGLYQAGPSSKDGGLNTAQTQSQPKVMAQTGTAVADLQYLDKNSDLLSDFEALDALDSEPTPDVN
jgi:hypothetical protein